MKREFIIKIIIFLILILTTILVLILIYKNLFLIQEKNIVNNKLINRGNGWAKNMSMYSGSELGFIFDRSEKISFNFSTDSHASQGVEILINDEKYSISSPNLNKQTLIIQTDKTKSNNVVVRHFCTYFYDPCELKINHIFVNRNSNIYSYQAHGKRLSILGDSLSTIYGKDNYGFLLANKLGFELHSASILGSSLTKIKGINNLIYRYEKDIKKFKSDLIIISIGSNDAVNNVPIENFSSDYLKMIMDIKKWHPASKIFLVGIFPRSDLDENILANYNDVIYKISKDTDTNFIDTSNWLSKSDYSDAIHPSITAQLKISEKLSEEIIKVINN